MAAIASDEPAETDAHAEPTHECDDRLKPVRGILIAGLVGVVLWSLLIGAAVSILSLVR